MILVQYITKWSYSNEIILEINNEKVDIAYIESLSEEDYFLESTTWNYNIPFFSCLKIIELIKSITYEKKVYGFGNKLTIEY